MKSLMRVSLSAAICLLGALGVSQAAAQHAAKSNLPKWDLEMTGPEYRSALNKLAKSKRQTSPYRSFEDEDLGPEEKAIEKYLAMGQKNLAWVDLVNTQRSPENQISFSSAATQNGYPISSPRVLNFQVIVDSWAILDALLPAPLHKVIFDGGEISANIPVSDREFIEWLIQVDRAYQLSARYKMLKPYRSELAEVAAYDVRGYLQLRDDAELDSKLEQWESLTPRQKERYRRALVQICRNAEESKDDCEDQFANKRDEKKIKDFKDSYMEAGRANYESFFKIPVSRTDTQWLTKENQAVELQIPFADPHNPAVTDYLKFNIEDEFRWNNWALKLNFIETDSLDTTHVVFVPGSTPHVNDLAGSEITMDANAPLSEYDVQWTIRHEYGHVLGFPDCYIEFYDEDEESIVSYQLDVTNLMCSRRGHFQQGHYDELERVYKK